MDAQEDMTPSTVVRQDRSCLVAYLNQCSSEYVPLLSRMYGTPDVDYRWMVLEQFSARGPINGWLNTCGSKKAILLRQHINFGA